jgi:hypothetical protein
MEALLVAALLELRQLIGAHAEQRLRLRGSARRVPGRVQWVGCTHAPQFIRADALQRAARRGWGLGANARFTALDAKPRGQLSCAETEETAAPRFPRGARERVALHQPERTAALPRNREGGGEAPKPR